MQLCSPLAGIFFDYLTPSKPVQCTQHPKPYSLKTDLNVVHKSVCLFQHMTPPYVKFSSGFPTLAKRPARLKLTDMSALSGLDKNALGSSKVSIFNEV